MLVLFHSHACEHSRMLLAELKRREMLGRLELASVEGVRESGRALPPEVTHVPAVWDTDAGRFHVGQAAFRFLLQNPGLAAAPAAPSGGHAVAPETEGLLAPASDAMYGGGGDAGLETYAPPGSGAGYGIPTAAAGADGDPLYPDGFLPKMPPGGRPENAGQLTEYPELPNMEDILRDRSSEFGPPPPQA